MSIIKMRTGRKFLKSFFAQFLQNLFLSADTWFIPFGKRYHLREMSHMNGKMKKTVQGIGLGLLLGAAAGAAGYCGVCGMPSKRKVRRRLLHAADSMSGALENLLNSI